MVELIGGSQYSNTLYGKDSRGLLMNYKTDDMTHTLVSQSTMEQTKSTRGFVAAKSYNRTDLYQMDGMLKGEFFVNNESFASTLCLFKGF